MKIHVILETNVLIAVSQLSNYKVLFDFGIWFIFSEVNCYDCGDTDQCYDNEDNGELVDCPTGSICYHVTGCKLPT